ncbi:hypothetical protein HU200_004978 [Digitaria exilis]|uniref:DUF4220 domain-containing protein n=1 Tax=Digitaria exilis TaxID=1010633 RepID=A0A835KT67_9POAL|nr:hypothetical protein HU200_004978 [Digitaria exilis]
MIAVYALGYLSQHKDATIAGVTIRGIELLAFFWAPFLLIHLVVVQVILSLYVFWKSIRRDNVELLLSGIFLFVAGIIKYGERTWSLKCGSFKSLQSSTGNHCKHRFPELIDGDVGYSNAVCTGLRSMLDVLNFFSGRTLFVGDNLRFGREGLATWLPNQVLKVLEVELGIMYDDLYTKAVVLRTRSGITLRCIAQLSALVAFAIFLAGKEHKYNRADIAITYLLFVGLIGWPEKRPLWSNAMGQYNLRGWFEGSGKPKSCGQRVMNMTLKLATSISVDKEKIFWLSKILETEYAKADKVMECLVETTSSFICRPYEFQRTLFMHMVTELHLSKYPCSDIEADVAADIDVLVEVCQKLSRYMMYLLLTLPSLLPLNASAVATLNKWQADMSEPGKEALEEIRDIWVRLTIYAAAKSQPEMHAAQLARGGEPLTFVWLQLAHYNCGDFGYSRIKLTRDRSKHSIFYVLQLHG